MGCVFLAEHIRFGTRVALKVLSISTDRARAAFVEEIRACCLLDHPNISRTFDYGLEPTPWFAMELARGQLVDEVRRSRSWRGTAVLVEQLLDALAHAHARNVIHRDLKPGNVLFALPDDRRPGVKLVDFGVAARGRGSIARAGTPAYMPPEQWEGLAGVGPWTDIYALGVLLWSLTTGRLPIDENDFDRLRHRQKLQQLDPYEPQMAVPPGLEEWLRVCMAPKPADRFRCVAEALDALPRQGQRGRVSGVFEAPEDAATLMESSTGRWNDEGDAGPAPGKPVNIQRLPTTFRSTVPPAAPAHVAGVGLGMVCWRRPPLFGREKERAYLWRMLVRCEATRAPLSLELVGPRGGGRSSLGDWLVQQARTQSSTLAVRVPAGAGLQGLVDAVLQPFGTPGELAGRLDGLAVHGAATESAILALRALENVYEGPRAAGMVLDLLAELARRRTVLVVVDADGGGFGLEALVRRWDQIDGPAVVVHHGLDVPSTHRLDVPHLPDAAATQSLAATLPLHPSLARELVDRGGGLPAITRRLLERVAPDLVLGPHGFELPGSLPDLRFLGDELPDDLDPDLRHRLVRLAHFDHDVPVEMWAESCGVSSGTAHLDAIRMAALGLCTQRSGRVRIRPTMREVMRASARATGGTLQHHRAVAKVLEHAGTQPHRLGAAWIGAGEVRRGVGVWLDRWHRIVALQGFEGMEGLLLRARDLIDEMPPSEALHGRLETVLSLVQDRGYPSSPAGPVLRRMRRAIQDGWFDHAAESAYYAALCTPSGAERRAVLEEALDTLRGRCAPGPWARLVVTTCLASRRWGFDPESDLVADGWQAVQEVEATRDCGAAALTTPALAMRLRHVMLSLVAAHRSEHQAAVLALERCAEISRAHDGASLFADLLDLAAAQIRVGDRAAAERVFQEVERRARWVGAAGMEAGTLAQRAGLAVFEHAWDRAARLAGRALIAIAPGYPAAMMRLIATLHLAEEGNVAPAVQVVDEVMVDLLLIQPPDPELRICMRHVQRSLNAAGVEIPRRWAPLWELMATQD